VSTIASLTSALANTAVSHIVLASGTYYLSAELSITRSVILEAAAGAMVILNAQASSSSQRRVLYINPGSWGVVQLIGLGLTGGYQLQNVCATKPLKMSHRPMGDSSFARCLQGGGVYVGGGTVAISSCNITGITAVRAHAQKFPSPRWDFHMCLARCLQGGSVFVQGGTVSIVNSQVYSNQAAYVLAHVQDFPSPR